MMTSLELVEVDPAGRPERFGLFAVGAGAVGLRQEDTSSLSYIVAAPEQLPSTHHGPCGCGMRQPVWRRSQAAVAAGPSADGTKRAGDWLSTPRSLSAEAPMQSPLRLAGARPRRRHRNSRGGEPLPLRGDTLHANVTPHFRLAPEAGRARAPRNISEATPGPAWPDALFGEPERALVRRGSPDFRLA